MLGAATERRLYGAEMPGLRRPAPGGRLSAGLPARPEMWERTPLAAPPLFPAGLLSRPRPAVNAGMIPSSAAGQLSHYGQGSSGSCGSGGNHSSSSSRSVPPGSRVRPTTPSGAGRTERRASGDDQPAGGPLMPGRFLSPGSYQQVPGYENGRDILLRKEMSPTHPEPLISRTSGDAARRSHSVALSGGGGGGGGGGGASSSTSSTCDKCDGKHSADRCPHFHREREKHKDAWVNYGKKGGPHQMGSSGGNFVLRSARVMRQPGDGSCLFHSLLHGLNTGGSAQTLRREIATFLQQNPSLQIAGDTLEEWVRWDSNTSVSEYARRIAVSGWGGGIEMACCSLLKNVNVHVYENAGRGFSEFKRISCFDAPNAARTIHVLYQGGVHYDALQPMS